MSAILSPCGRYRFRLERPVQRDRNLVIAYFGINPSTADAEINDHTITKLIEFSRRFGAKKLIVGNVFPLRATDVGKLWHEATDHDVTMLNMSHVDKIINDSHILVPCWGSRTKIPGILRYRLDAMAQHLTSSGKPVRVFGLTKGGDPLHPLMLPYTTTLTDWRK